jgi:hypothetical protein
MIGLSVISYLIALVGFPLVLLALRILEVVTRRINLKDALIIILTPLSIGYFYLIPSNGFLKKVYRSFAIFFFVLLVIGSFFIFYMVK